MADHQPSRDVEDPATAEIPEVMPSDGDVADPPDEDDEQPAVKEPARVMRIGSMIRHLLDEVRQAPLDEASRDRLKQIYETSVSELSGSLSEDLAEELDRLALPFESDTPTEAELRVAQAQLVGWLEGLFHGMQAALFAQQMAAQQQLQQMRSQGQLGPGAPRPDGGGGERPGVYL